MLEVGSVQHLGAGVASIPLHEQCHHFAPRLLLVPGQPTPLHQSRYLQQIPLVVSGKWDSVYMVLSRKQLISLDNGDSMAAYVQTLLLPTWLLSSNP